MKILSIKKTSYIVFSFVLIALIYQIELPFSKWYLVLIPFATFVVLGFLLLLSMVLMGLVGWAYMWISKEKKDDSST